MTAFPSYSTGTVSIAANGTSVTGAGTIWSGVNARPGDMLQVGDFQTIISDVTDTATLVIPPWGGGAQSGAAYVIWQTSPLRYAGGQAMADVATLVAALNTDGFYVFVASTLTAPDPSYGNDGQYAFQPSTKKLWFKESGVWNFLGIFSGFNLKGAWNSATAYGVFDVVSRDGSSYVAIADNTDVDPAADGSPPSWEVLAEKGDTGATGATGASGAPGTNGTNAPTYGGTSTTSLSIATGAQAFTTQAGLAYQNGARVRASSAANTSNWMEGLVTYSGISLTITVDKTNGSGTHADWNFNIVGQPGSGDLSSANNLSDVANAATALGNLGGVSYGAAQTLTGAQKDQAQVNLGLPAVMRSYLAGLTLSTAGSSPSFSVASGVATDSGNADAIQLASSLTKSVNTWSVGASQGSLDTGSSNSASTWYHVYLIKRPDTGVVDVCTSLSASAPTIGSNIPSAYTLYRRIGAMLINGSGNWTAFSQLGDTFTWVKPISESIGVIGSTTPTLKTLTGVPSGLKVTAMVNAGIAASSTDSRGFVLSADSSGATSAAGCWNVGISGVSAGQGYSCIQAVTNTSAQLLFCTNGSSDSMQVGTAGWIDRRGRDS